MKSIKQKFIFPILFILGLTLLNSCKNNTSSPSLTQAPTDTLQITKNLLFGFDLAQYEVVFDTIQNGWTWNNIFENFDISQFSINQTAKRLKSDQYNLDYIVAGKPIAKFIPKHDSTNRPTMLVYEPDPFSYITIAVNEDTINIQKEKRPITIKEKTIHGVIAQNSNLSEEVGKNFASYNMTASITEAFEAIYGWSVDFFRLQAGDKFVAVFDEKCVDGKPYTIDKIKYIWFEHSDADLYAFYYADSTHDVYGYYDELGNDMKRQFLMAPVKYSRISSGYSPRRFHPVQKRYKAHLGTDYAAPTGTPICATADGRVTRATRSKYNGIYVKIRHNSVYETQYLHMSKIAKGIHPGEFVKQGQTIGYVGSTGLATGPHVCYRFWKNGKQINHRTANIPKSDPMKEEAKPLYLKHIAPLKAKLDKEAEKIKANQNPVV